MNPEQKTKWLVNLSEFIVEANLNTWAADAPEVEPQRPGYKELEYRSSDGLWLLRDSYAGYFRAPGTTTVYYKDAPSWSQAYGGVGMGEGSYDIVKPAFQFLKEALMKVKPELPFRGPTEHISDDGQWVYRFTLTNRNEMDAVWREEVRQRITAEGYKLDQAVFTQVGFAGIILPRTTDRKVQFPWER